MWATRKQKIALLVVTIVILIFMWQLKAFDDACIRGRYPTNDC